MIEGASFRKEPIYQSNCVNDVVGYDGIVQLKATLRLAMVVGN